MESTRTKSEVLFSSLYHHKMTQKYNEGHPLYLLPALKANKNAHWNIHSVQIIFLCKPTTVEAIIIFNVSTVLSFMAPENYHIQSGPPNNNQFMLVKRCNIHERIYNN